MSDLKMQGPGGDEDLTPQDPDENLNASPSPAWKPQAPKLATGGEQSSGRGGKIFVVLILLAGLGAYGYSQKWHELFFGGEEPEQEFNVEETLNMEETLKKYEVKSAEYLLLENEFKKVSRRNKTLKSKMKEADRVTGVCDDKIQGLKISIDDEDAVVRELQAKYGNAGRHNKKVLAQSIASSDKRAVILQRKLADAEKLKQKEENKYDDFKEELNIGSEELSDLEIKMKRKAPGLQKLQDILTEASQDDVEGE